ncbi:uncharacterized protein LOC119090903 [Pollicipes pollicipes]|uniref:uncharacterized protein LOC119090903 n=1 Tax=Pollicipes pollicipes TaxID=41117 RepID=UPI001884EF7F|nr:uncharacterized protein LOC119090903 [Pollicipes pollicipes]
MLAADGRARWLAAWALALLSTVGTCRLTPLCHAACCIFTPDCRNAVSMLCNCSIILQITRESIPASVRHVKIWNSSYVSVASDAVYNTPLLRTLEFMSLAELHIHSNGLRLQKHAAMRVLRVGSVNTLVINSSALSGDWHHETSVSLQRIEELQLRPEAFNFTSISGGPRVLLGNVQALMTEEESFAAAIGRLSVVNVGMESCPSRCFSGSISHLELIGVHITNARAHCVDGRDGWGTLSIRASQLTSIQSLAFHGNFREVVIDNAKVGAVQKFGLDLRLTRLLVKASSFQDLASRGLEVVAKDSIVLDRVSVSILRRHAFRGLHVSRAEVSRYVTGTLIVRSLHIDKAKDGSLAFEEGVRVCIDRLNVSLSLVCPAAKWARQLTGASEPLSQAQRQVLRQLQSRCPPSAEAPLPAASSDSPCSDATGRPGREGHQHRLALYCGLGVLVVLAVAVLSVTLALWQRRARAAQLPPELRLSSAERCWGRRIGRGSDRPEAAAGGSRSPAIDAAADAELRTSRLLSSTERESETPRMSDGRQTGPSQITSDSIRNTASDDGMYEVVGGVHFPPPPAGPAANGAGRWTSSPEDPGAAPPPSTVIEGLLPGMELVDNELYVTTGKAAP